MIPQIIYLVILGLGLIIYGYRHGKPKEGKYNLFLDLFATFMSIWLLYAGGFFNPLFK